MIGTVLAFIASLLLHGLLALRDAPPPPGAESDATGLLLAERPVDMIQILLMPQGPVTLSLLAVLCLGLGYHGLRLWRGAGMGGPGLTLGLAAGALWPWLADGRPLAAAALALVMMAGLVTAALAGLRQEGFRQEGRSRNSAALSFAAGWATLAAMAMVAALLKRDLGVPALLAACVGLSLAALITVSVQLRLGRSISYSIAVIWGLIAIAAGAMLASVGLATLAVLAIAVIAVALVQVST